MSELLVTAPTLEAFDSYPGLGLFSLAGLIAISRARGPSNQGRFTKELGALSTRRFEIDGRR